MKKDTDSQSTIKPKICLNMIVKDEEHIIAETLECMAKYVDYYVISDTGSTDRTMEIIKEFMDIKGIPGEIFQDEWKNFGYNRSVALKECEGKSDYIWIIDADDVIRGDLVLPEIMDQDCYLLQYGTGFRYFRMQIFKNDPKFKWKYRGVLHEYPDSVIHDFKKMNIVGNYYVDSRRLGARSADPEKYKKDAILLEQGLKDEPDNERYVFYLAQSYLDYGDKENALKNYRRRVKMGGWYEEVYYSLYKIGEILEKQDKWGQAERAYLDAYKVCNHRADTLYKLATHYRHKKDFERAYKYAKLGSKIPYPTKDVLFVFQDVYDYKILDELSISAYYVGRYRESLKISKKLLDSDKTPKEYHPRIKMNLRFAASKLQNEKPICLIYTINNNLDESFWDITKTLVDYYTIFIYCPNLLLPNEFTDFIYITRNMLSGIKNRVNVTLLYNNINLFFDKKIRHIKSKLILWQTDDKIKLGTSYGLFIDYYNQGTLNQYIHRISRIACSSKSIMKNLIQAYALPKELFHIFDKKEYFEFIDEDVSLESKLIVKTGDRDFINGGINIRLPKYLIHSIKCNKSQDIMTNLLQQLRRELPQFPEITYQTLKMYVKLGSKEIAKALKLLDKLEIECGAKKYANLQLLLQVEKGKLQFQNGDHYEAFKTFDDVLNNSIPQKETQKIQIQRDACIDHFKDIFLKYPENRIDTIKQNPEKNVMFSITSCKRFDLFEKTMNSFINCCEDFDKIDYWLCVDDNSVSKDRELMQKRYPFFDFIFKTESQKGHHVSMNIIHEKMVNYKYLIHLEDDFHFINKRRYISDGIEILTDNPKLNIGQVVFNKNYAEIDFSKMNIVGGIPQQTCNKLPYLMHEHIPDQHGEAYKEFMKRNDNGANSAYWPHFSFRPSIHVCAVWRDIGLFYKTNHFEMAFAQEYTDKGYKTAFFDNFTAIHIGKKTWEKGENSYVKNKTTQFTIENENYPFKIISRNAKNWKTFKTHAYNILPNYWRCIVDNKAIEEKDMYIFRKNYFNYQKNIINHASTHINLWSNEDVIILEDNVQFCSNFMDKIKALLESKSRFDICVLGLSNTKSKYCKNRLALGYIINGNCKHKLLDINVRCPINCFIQHQHLKVEYIDLLNEVCPYENEENKIINFDGYIFFSELDSPGNDIKYIGKKTLHELKKMADKNQNCVGFNTLGWLKEAVVPENELKSLWGSESAKDGIYIKKECLASLSYTFDNLEGYTFYRMMDSYGHDIMHYLKPLSEMKVFCDKNDFCAGFNTSGYMKYKIRPKNELFKYSNNFKDGLYVKDASTRSLEKSIEKINKNKCKSNITFTVTTCKRWDLFERTMDMLILTVSDIYFIEHWICIDDNSSKEDREKMRKKYPFFEFIFKEPNDKGHVKSLNMLWDAIKTDYIIHFEDDWLVKESFKLMPLLNYVKSGATDHLILRAISDQAAISKAPIADSIENVNIYRYVYNHKHHLKPQLNKEYDSKNVNINHNISTNYAKTEHWWWPGFSLNPSIINIKKIKGQVGYFNSEIRQELFEYDYAYRCKEKSIDVQFVRLNIDHIGDISSYSLNDMKRHYDK